MVDVVVIGAGAAGMMCASVAGQRGLSVVLIDHAEKLGEKIRISGGGRCNFTNREVGTANFLSENPRFAYSALSRYTPQDFLALLAKYRIGWHEKHRGQLFCDASSEDIIEVLRQECAAGRVQWRMPCQVDGIEGAAGGGFTLGTSQGPLSARQVVIATGGLPVAQIGATDFGLRIAKQFGMPLVDTRPALVPLTFPAEVWAPFLALAGVSLEVDIRTGEGKAQAQFREDLLFTHRGLSGPAVLQISSHWNPGQALRIDFCPGQDLRASLRQGKQGGRQHLSTLLASMLPKRLADFFLDASPALQGKPLGEHRVADVPDRMLDALAASVQAWRITPSGTAGYKKAEVMRGGVSTRALNQQSLESKTVPGLYFIGEVVDMTGWLGGYNFQWAWSSGVACGRALRAAE
ncbi:MAG: NAD(P)/FAD-dependent oxidoreductase [Pigmentiphaga sp.]